VLPVPDRRQARLGGKDGDDQPELVGRQWRLQPVRHAEDAREIGVGGPIREQYLVTPFDTEDESDLVTEVCWPVLGAVTPDLA
jgi:hypothetical protein